MTKTEEWSRASEKRLTNARARGTSCIKTKRKATRNSLVSLLVLSTMVFSVKDTLDTIISSRALFLLNAPPALPQAPDTDLRLSERREAAPLTLSYARSRASADEDDQSISTGSFDKPEPCIELRALTATKRNKTASLTGRVSFIQASLPVTIRNYVNGVTKPIRAIGNGLPLEDWRQAHAFHSSNKLPGQAKLHLKTQFQNDNVLFMNKIRDILRLFQWRPIAFVDAIRLLRIDSPQSIQAGQPLKLRCLYDPKGDKLQSLSWYKNGKEFYRYQPFEQRRPVLAFNLTGVNVDLTKSRNNTVVLVNTTIETSGRYKCEATGSSFMEVNMDTYVSVISASKSYAISLIFCYKEVACVYSIALVVVSLMRYFRIEAI